MNASVFPNAFLNKEGTDSINAIESISLMLSAVKIDPFPFLFKKIFSLYLIIKLTYLNKKIKEVSNQAKDKIKFMSYEEAKECYAKLSKINKTINPADYNNPSHHNLERLTDRLFIKALSMLKETEDTFSSVLFYKIDSDIQLTDKEKEGFAAFNEIWGDDDDEVYAKDTHSHLTESL